jgi:hypothetical protein
MFVRNASARAALAILALAMLTDLGCGGGGGGSNSTPTSPTAPSSPSTPVTGNPCTAIAGLFTTPQTIVNGTDCIAQTYASSVLKLLRQNSAGERFTCSSTVIDDQWVLTAAHCLPADTTQVQVDLGPGPLVVATEFHASPLYTGAGDGSPDVGVVKFPQSLGHKLVPLLLTRDATPGEPAVIAGYGQSATGSVGILRAGFVTISDRTDAYVVVTATAPTASATCSGDSGGPLLISQGGEWAVAGITSSATDYCVNGTSYFARVKNDAVQNFILNYVPDAGQR